MRKITYIVILVLVIISTTVITTKVYNNSRIFYTQSIPISINVSNYTGIITENKLDFGTNKPGNSVKKPFIITNSDINNHIIRLEPKTDFNNWIHISENNFILLSNETKEILIDIQVPNNAKYGHYEGNLKVTFFK